MTTMFILKQRDLWNGGRNNPYRPRGQICYGPWKRVADFGTMQQAHSALLDVGTGLVDRAVFYKGKRVTEANGRVRTSLLATLTEGEGK